MPRYSVPLVLCILCPYLEPPLNDTLRAATDIPTIRCFFIKPEVTSLRVHLSTASGICMIPNHNVCSSWCIFSLEVILTPFSRGRRIFFQFIFNMSIACFRREPETIYPHSAFSKKDICDSGEGESFRNKMSCTHC